MRGPSRQTTSEAGRRRIGARGDGAGEIGNDQTFGAVGDACQVSGRPGASSSAGLRAMPTSRPSPLR